MPLEREATERYSTRLTSRMKILALIISFTFMLAGSFQSANKYEFKVNDVHTIADAKEVSEVLTPIFDKTPSFIDDTDMFVVYSDVVITETKLSTKLLKQGWVLEEFKGPERATEQK